MTTTALTALLPLIILALTAVVVMLASAFFRRHALIAALALLGQLAALASIALAAHAITVATPTAVLPVTPLLIVDAFALLFTMALLISGIVVTLFAHNYLARRPGLPEEFYLLLLLALLGATTLAFSCHFASFFLALELLSVSLYAMLSYVRGNPLTIEAGIKYLVLSSVASAFLLFGMALVYTELGVMTFAGIAAHAGGSLSGSLTLLGLGLLVAGISFKLALFPFGFWVPDVYQGSPAPATAFIASVSKGAVVAVLLRLFLPLAIQHSTPLFVLFSVLAIASMFIGNLLALRQQHVKRLLAYSSISNMGYLLVAFLASGAWAAPAVTFFLFAYLLTILLAFGVVTVLSGARRDADALDDYCGLAWRRPWLAAIFSIALLSLAGLPLTVGFIGKFLLLLAGVQSRLWLLVVLLVVNSAIGLYYYLRVIIAMYRHPEEHPEPASMPPLSAIDAVTLAALTLLLLWLGIYPAPLIHLIQAVVAGM